MKYISIITVLTACFLYACNTEMPNESFELQGTLDDLKEGTVYLTIYDPAGKKNDTATVVDGQFVFKGNYPTPVMGQLYVDRIKNFRIMYLENKKITLTGSSADLKHTIISGSPVNVGYDLFTKQYDELCQPYNDTLNYYRNNRANLTKEQKEIQQSLIADLGLKRKVLVDEFIKQHPDQYYAGMLLFRKIAGLTALEKKKVLDSVDPVLKEHSLIKDLLPKMEEMLDVEIGIDKIMATASNVKYNIDKPFLGNDHKNIIYLDVLSNNKVCALLKDASIKIIDQDGKHLKSFKTNIATRATVLATDDHDQIYVMANEYKMVKKKVRGKMIDIKTPSGVKCFVFNQDGKEIKQLELTSIVSATGAKISGEHLLVADTKGRMITVFDKESGQTISSISNLRTCCGILDFSVNDKKEVLVANLGAFRVQAYDFSGKQLVAFGQRGKGLDDFHGCCNPVSVAYLSNGAMVTVEKDPTRIKVYSKEGAKIVEGIQELVEGCSHIPMTVDDNDNLYLASEKKGLVKCVPAL